MNKKEILIKIAIIVIVLFVSIFALVSFNGIRIKQANIWMKSIDDNKLIVEMSIPGTHDSGANHSIFDVSGKCQDLTINEQLKIGVRFFDIRLQIVNNELNVVHSFVDQKQKFIKVMNTINTFIEENPSEFIIVSLKEDADSKNSNIDFDEKLIDDLKLFNNVCYDNYLPQYLSEARGKIYILNRFTSNNFGIQAYMGWLDSTSFNLESLYVQDNYCITDIEVKKQDIINTIEYGNSNNLLTLNFTSCYFDYGFPPTYAIPPAKIINKWLIDYINQNENQNLGIMVMDFITKELCNEIIRRN